MQDCKMCGKCCEVLSIHSSYDDILQRILTAGDEYGDDEYGDMVNRALCGEVMNYGGELNLDDIFMMLYFEEVTMEEAIKINKFMSTGVNGHFYTCKAFINGRCSQQTNKCKCCSEFPFYDHGETLPSTFNPYTENCGYNKYIVVEGEADEI